MIQIDNLSVRYPSGTVGLKATNITFSASEITVLLGLSGAGKSTLLRSLNRLVPPSTGSVTVDGIGDLANRATLQDHRRGTAMIFQQHQLIGRYTALQNVLVGRIGFHSALRTLFPISKAERLLALESLDRVGLLEKALERADALSGGQQQRVGIARALAQRPRLVLADEPVASLDPATSEKVLSLLQQICREDGIPAIISLHQLDLARTFADRIVGLAGGEVVFDGPPDALDARQVARIYARDPQDVAEGASAAPNISVITPPLDKLEIAR